jgi:arabinose-5-phosphate isomerase
VQERIAINRIWTNFNMTQGTSLIQEAALSSIDVRNVAKRVLAIEIQGLALLRDHLPEAFEPVVDALLGTTGRVVLTGIGKSGHIAHKIAATLASTGTPAFFVHPAEANHGDLGMVRASDAIIALSESGESQELSGILHYARENSCLLVGITRNLNSTLGRASSFVLRLPPAEPACPLRLAPTTSTTMMLALGDALAIALLEKRGFTAEQFKNFHPGGQLGRHLQCVADVMHTGVALPLVMESSIMMDVVLEMTAKRLGCAGVLNAQGHLVGIITDGDLRRHIGLKNFTERRAEDTMTRPPRTIDRSVYVKDALHVMNESAITTLFVVDDEHRPQGILHLHDLLRAVDTAIIL